MNAQRRTGKPNVHYGEVLRDDGVTRPTTGIDPENGRKIGRGSHLPC